ncbi:MAG: hypothetical protein FWG87_08770 [Defluviitaleaceae bacterium]|nr:hypothetical protein [Defluviitaleaceae bacterium]
MQIKHGFNGFSRIVRIRSWENPTTSTRSRVVYIKHGFKGFKGFKGFTRIFTDYADWLVVKFTKIHENPLRPLKSA